MDQILEFFQTVKELTGHSPEAAAPSQRQKAIAFLTSILPAHRNEPRLQNKLAQLLIADGQFTEAEKMLGDTVDPARSWATQRTRLDLYRLRIAQAGAAAPAPELIRKCDDLMHHFASARITDPADIKGNYAKFKMVIGLYMNLGRLSECARLLKRLNSRFPGLGASISYLRQQISLLDEYGAAAPSTAQPRAPKNKNAFLEKLLLEIQEVQSRQDVHAGKGFGKTHSQLFLPLDNLTYTDALEYFVSGDSSAAVNSLKALFVKNVFDPFAAILFLACSDQNSDLHGTIKSAFGAKQYGRFLTIATRLKSHRNQIMGAPQPIRGSSVIGGVYRPIPIDHAAAKILKSKIYRTDKLQS